MSRAVAIASAGWRLVAAASRPSILNRGISSAPFIARSYHLPVGPHHHGVLNSRFLFPAGLNRGYARRGGGGGGKAQTKDEDEDEDGDDFDDEDDLDDVSDDEDAFEGYNVSSDGDDYPEK